MNKNYIFFSHFHAQIFICNHTRYNQEYIGVLHMLVILKIEPRWGNFPSHRHHVGHHTSREEIKDITLKHMTHIPSILQVTTSTASS